MVPITVKSDRGQFLFIAGVFIGLFFLMGALIREMPGSRIHFDYYFILWMLFATVPPLWGLVRFSSPANNGFKHPFSWKGYCLWIIGVLAGIYAVIGGMFNAISSFATWSPEMQQLIFLMPQTTALAAAFYLACQFLLWSRWTPQKDFIIMDKKGKVYAPGMIVKIYPFLTYKFRLLGTKEWIRSFEKPIDCEDGKYLLVLATSVEIDSGAIPERMHDFQFAKEASDWIFEIIQAHARSEKMTVGQLIMRAKKGLSSRQTKFIGGFKIYWDTKADLILK